MVMERISPDMFGSVFTGSRSLAQLAVVLLLVAGFLVAGRMRQSRVQAFDPLQDRFELNFARDSFAQESSHLVMGAESPPASVPIRGWFQNGPCSPYGL